MSITHSRAAVICLGGWGLQTMLHLWPRLSSTQEMRFSLGAGRLADLTRNSAFACVLPEAVTPNVISADPASFYRPFRILQPAGAAPSSFYLEEALAQVRQRSGADVFPQRSQSERVGAYLLQQVEQSQPPLLQEVPLGTPTVLRLPPAGQRMSRAEMFEQGVIWAESLARALIEQVIDPTRLDDLDPANPYVRTSIYVVASLTEATTSPFIWPLLAELVAMLDNRSLTSVIGLLNTGSFATDNSRPFEEAAAHVALRELLVLEQNPANNQAAAIMARLVRQTSVANWAERVGKPIFNRIYLLDREKSNQALARDSVELAVLAGNAIEAFLIADGAHHIEQALGFAVDGSRDAPYSLIGAANNYVPLMQYLRAAVLEERKRIVRDEVLIGLPDEPPSIGLEELGVTPAAAVNQMLSLGDRIFVAEAATQSLGRRLPWRQLQPATEPSAGWLPELGIAADYLYPSVVAAELRQRHQLWQWRALAEDQAARMIAVLPNDLQTMYFEDAWGLEYWRALREDAEPTILLAQFHSQTWAQRQQPERRALPAAIFRALLLTTAELTATPDGIGLAWARLRGWLVATEEVLEAVGQRDAAAEREAWEAADQHDYLLWLREFRRASTQQPQEAAIWARGILPALLAIYLLITWLDVLAPRPLTPTGWFGVALVCICTVGLLCVGPLLVMRARVQWVRAWRIQLARQRAAHLANDLLRNSLARVYSQLHEDLSLLLNPLERAVQELRQWSQPLDLPPVPPPGVASTHLRMPLINADIWRQVQAIVEDRRDSLGRTGQEALFELWTQDGHNLRNWEQHGPGLAQRARLALELDLHGRELNHAAGLIELEARRRVRAATALGAAPLHGADTSIGGLHAQVSSGLGQGHWCPFATAAEPNHSLPERRPACVACPSLQLYRCPFSNAGQWQQPEWGIGGLLRQYTERAVAHLQPQRDGLFAQPGFLRHLVEGNSIEQQLAPEASEQATVNAAALVEDVWARAKPAASYDADGVRAGGLEVEFAVTTNGGGSRLSKSFTHRNMSLLASYDPLSLSVVRTVNDLAPEQLQLVERRATEYYRLHTDDRALLALPDQQPDTDVLYGAVPSGTVPYTRSME